MNSRDGLVGPFATTWERAKFPLEEGARSGEGQKIKVFRSFSNIDQAEFRDETSP